MHMPLGTAFIGLGFILLICRDIDFDASKKLLFSYAVFIISCTFTSAIQSFSRKS